jgi:hypothetical protein
VRAARRRGPTPKLSITTVNILVSELVAKPVETRISEFPRVERIIGNAPTSPFSGNRASLAW